MPQSKITDYFLNIENFPQEYLKRVLQQLNKGSYKDSSISLLSSEFTEGSLESAIGDEEVILLCEALKKNPHVKKVVFYLQNVGNEGVKALVSVDTIEELFFFYGQIKYEGAMALAKSKIKTLGIAGDDIFYDPNDIKEIDKDKTFIKTLVKNKNITNLSLIKTDLGKNLLIELIENTKSITELYLREDEINAEDIKDLHISQKEMQIYAGEEIVLFGEGFQEG